MDTLIELEIATKVYWAYRVSPPTILKILNTSTYMILIVVTTIYFFTSTYRLMKAIKNSPGKKSNHSRVSCKI